MILMQNLIVSLCKSFTSCFSSQEVTSLKPAKDPRKNMRVYMYLQNRSEEKCCNDGHENASSSIKFMPGVVLTIFMLGINVIEEFKLDIYIKCQQFDAFTYRILIPG